MDNQFWSWGGAGEELRRSWGGAGFNGWAWVLEALGVCYFVTCILLHCGGVSGSRYTCVHQLPDFPPQISRIDVTKKHIPNPLVFEGSWHVLLSNI